MKGNHPWFLNDKASCITSFIVVKPTNEFESYGEKLNLSIHGEYCPKQSLRGYQLAFLLEHPENYKVGKIIQKGQEKMILGNSKDWQDFFEGLIIIDPSGWDRKNYEYSFNNELIGFEEFTKRLMNSTIQANKSVFEYNPYV